MMIRRSTFVRTALAAALGTLLSSCGGDGGVSDISVQVTPAKGMIINGVVTIYDTSGRRLARGDTGSSGSAQLEIPGDLLLIGGQYRPVMVEVRASTSTRIWDENGDFERGRFIEPNEIPSDFSLMAISPRVREHMGVTALTTASAAAAGITNPSQPPAGLDSEAFVSAIARVNALMGLPADFDITRALTPAGPDQPNPSDEYGALIRAITLQSGRLGALQQVSDFKRVGELLKVNELPASSIELARIVNQAARDLAIPNTPATIPTTSDELAARVREIIDILRQKLTDGGNTTGVTGVTGITGLTN